MGASVDSPDDEEAGHDRTFRGWKGKVHAGLTSGVGLLLFLALLAVFVLMALYNLTGDDEDAAP